MIYRWFVRRQALAGWQRLSESTIDELPLADEVHFVYLGDHPLAADLAEPMPSVRGYAMSSSVACPACASRLRT
jgi:hypothetical protein